MSKDRTLCEYNEKNPDIIEHLENWVKGRYRKECGSGCLGDSSIDGFSVGWIMDADIKANVPKLPDELSWLDKE